MNQGTFARKDKDFNIDVHQLLKYDESLVTVIDHARFPQILKSARRNASNFCHSTQHS